MNKINILNLKLKPLLYMSKHGAHTGFVGLGIMGKNMSRNLMEKGNSLVVYDIDKNVMDEYGKKGAKLASNPAEVSQQCDTVFTMLPTCAHVKEVYLGKNGLLSGSKPGLVLVDSSTIHPNTSREVFQAAKEKNVDFLDAPVAGALPAAIAGTLTFMVGGSKSVLEKIKPLFMGMGKNIVHCGEVGSGEVAKICNNMLLGICMLGTCEALNLAKRNGLDLKIMNNIINTSSGRSWVSEVYNPVPNLMQNVPSSNNYEPGFKIDLLTKDLCLADDLSNKSSSLTPLAALTLNWYKSLMNNGYGGKDMSFIYQFISEQK